MQKTQKNNHFIVVSERGGVVNILVPSLFYDRERAAILQTILLKRVAIEDVLISSEANSVEIKFDSQKLPKIELFEVLNIVLANFSEKPSEKDKSVGDPSVKNEGVVQRMVVSIDGMSCPSCALYIEMTLTRDKRVISASINYKSKKGVVIGFLNLNEVVAIINEHGYKASTSEKV